MMAAEWLAKADADLRACDELLSTVALSEIAAFHAQQAAEKASKAFLVWNQDASQLTPYGVEYRYPGDYPAVPAATARESVDLATRVRDAVAECLRDELGR